MEGGARQEFKEGLNSIMEELKQDYTEFLKCLKFQNKKDRLEEEKLLKKIRKQKQEDRVDFTDNLQQTAYSFNEEISKENRLEISFIRLIRGLNRLSQFHAKLKEHLVINMEESVQIRSITDTINTMLTPKK